MQLLIIFLVSSLHATPPPSVKDIGTLLEPALVNPTPTGPPNELRQEVPAQTNLDPKSARKVSVDKGMPHINLTELVRS